MNQLVRICLLLGILVIVSVPNESSTRLKRFHDPRGRDNNDEPEDEEPSDEEDDGPVGPMNLGRIQAFSHDVSSGDVTLVDDKTIKIRNFKYDGLGPAAWFVVGTSNRYKTQFVTLDDAIAIPDENESCDRLGKYRNDNLKLKLPGKMKFSDYNYLSIYCLRFNENFGYIEIPDEKFRNGSAPGLDECPQTLVRDGRRLKYHGLSSNARSKIKYR